ncbi:hypothetical protein JRQ81_001090 [Phrynocephalus forsythii]|uniref:Serpin domain-containing protein n=1 Tax=Phrynocephalus forsythii TaxID=171643 RepID=A0A9Q0Y6H6_9SAUR|nr:hypothetical protein JRQ81_001090 [Phrynocephalus forsythii]
MSPVNLCLFFAGLFSVANGKSHPAKQQSSALFLKIAPGNADFAFRFYHQIALEEIGKNIFFSPLSISTAFALVSLGAKSTTLSQLLLGLGFRQAEINDHEIHEGFRHLLQELNRPQAEAEVSLGNALFMHDQYKLLKKFLNDAKRLYHTGVLPTNFKNTQEAVKKINDYIEKKTHGKLVDVVKELDPQVVVVLVNYIFFKDFFHRNKMFNLWVLFAGLFTVASCAIVRSAQQQSNLPFLKVASVNSVFAFKLYHWIASEETGKNIFLSPFSISTAFAFLSLGAKSSTLSQLLSGLGFNLKETSEEEIHKAFQHLIQALNHPKGEIEVSLGNALFVQDQFKILQKFLTDAKNIYHANVVSTNFKKPQEATKQINSYIEKQTHGKLVDAIKDLDSSVLAVLVNYMFFRARWERPFYSNVTKKMDLFLDGKTKVQVPTMINDNYYQYYYDKKLFYQVVCLPYKGKVSAYFVLPDPGKLKQVEAALGKDTLSNWGKSLSEK